jgi:maltose alpha-D-glucosyltransferase/alpha-amylase
MTAFDGPVRALETELRKAGELRRWLQSRRWCGEGLGFKTEVAVKDRAILWEGPGEVLVWLLATAKEANVTVPMNLPFHVADNRQSPDAFELEVGGAPWFVVEAERSEPFARFLADGFRTSATIRTEQADTLSFHGERWTPFRAMGPTMDTDSSNLLLPFFTEAREVLFKSYKLPDVYNREPDLVARLDKRGFHDVPRYLGELTLGKGDDRVALGIAVEFLETVDLFTWLTQQWRAELLGGESPSIPDFEKVSLDVAAALGEKAAEMHAALYDDHAGPFQRETFTAEDLEASTKSALSNLTDALVRLATLAKDKDRTVGVRAAAARGMLFENREQIEVVLRGIDATMGTPKCVTHADLHLGQVLRTKDDRLLFIDFEGEPERVPGQRHVKLPPLRDIATLNRSFAYVTHYAWRASTRGDASAALRLLTRTSFSPEESVVAERLVAWERAAGERCARAYLVRSALYHDMDPADAIRAIRGWMIEKALYELRYELKHRPENVFIPLEGVMSLIVDAE